MTTSSNTPAVGPLPFPSLSSLMPPAELTTRITRLESARILHPAFYHALSSIADLWAFSPSRLPSPCPKAKAKLLYGPRGAGVSAVIAAFVDCLSTQEGEDGAPSQILRVSLAAPSMSNNRSKSALRQPSDPTSSINGVTEEVDLICSTAQMHNVRLLILEEAEVLMDSSDPQAVAEFLERLLHGLPCNLLISGKCPISILAEFAPIASRIEGVIPMLPYDWQASEGRAEFMRLLQDIENLLDLPQPSRFAAADFARRLYAASGGLLGPLVDYVSLGMKLAARRDWPAIDVSLMAEAYALRHYVPATPPVVDLEASCPREEGQSLASLRERVMRPQLDAQANPFACTPERLTLLCAQVRRKAERSSRAPAFSPRPRARPSFVQQQLTML